MLIAVHIRTGGDRWRSFGTRRLSRRCNSRLPAGSGHRLQSATSCIGSKGRRDSRTFARHRLGIRGLPPFLRSVRSQWMWPSKWADPGMPSSGPSSLALEFVTREVWTLYCGCCIPCGDGAVYVDEKGLRPVQNPVSPAPFSSAAVVASIFARKVATEEHSWSLRWQHVKFRRQCRQR